MLSQLSYILSQTTLDIILTFIHYVTNYPEWYPDCHTYCHKLSWILSQLSYNLLQTILSVIPTVLHFVTNYPKCYSNCPKYSLKSSQISSQIRTFNKSFNNNHQFPKIFKMFPHLFVKSPVGNPIAIQNVWLVTVHQTWTGTDTKPNAQV